jgi:hypothetical protein
VQTGGVDVKAGTLPKGPKSCPQAQDFELTPRGLGVPWSRNGFGASEARCALIDTERARGPRAERVERGPKPCRPNARASARGRVGFMSGPCGRGRTAMSAYDESRSRHVTAGPTTAFGARAIRSDERYYAISSR